MSAPGMPAGLSPQEVAAGVQDGARVFSANGARQDDPPDHAGQGRDELMIRGGFPLVLRQEAARPIESISDPCRQGAMGRTGGTRNLGPQRRQWTSPLGMRNVSGTQVGINHGLKTSIVGRLRQRLR